MNVASGQCMASTMQGYAIMLNCSNADPAQMWEWDFSSFDTSGTKMKHTASGYFLQCGCEGKT